MCLRLRLPFPSVATCLIALLLIASSFAATTSAQERRTFDEGGFDPRKAVAFEESASNSLHAAVSPDGKMRAESTYQKIRVFSVEEDELLYEFSTSGNTNSPLFSADAKTLFAAVCRGNLGCISTLYSWNLETGKRTRIGECSGLVLDASVDSSGKHLALATWYGDLGTISLYSKHRKWLGGEIVVFDVTKPKESIRILCELTGVQDFEGHENWGEDPAKFGETVKKTLSEANRRCLPVRVGLTSGGEKVIAATSTGAIRVFDAATGAPELSLNSQSRVGAEIFSER